MSKYGFKSSEHAMNYVNKAMTNKNRKQPVKVYTGDELKAFASSMGLVVSPNHKAPEAKAPKKNEVEIVVEHLPPSLRKMLK